MARRFPPRRRSRSCRRATSSRGCTGERASSTSRSCCRSAARTPLQRVADATAVAAAVDAPLAGLVHLLDDDATLLAASGGHGTPVAVPEAARPIFTAALATVTAR